MIVAVALFVQRAGNKLFACAGFAMDQYSGVGGGDFMDAVVQVLHHIAGANHAGNGGTCSLGAVGGLICRFGFADYAFNGINHLVVVEGFGDIVHCAHAHGVYC